MPSNVEDLSVNEKLHKKRKVPIALSDSKNQMTPEKKAKVLKAVKECNKIEDYTESVRFLYPDNDPTKGSPVAAETTTPRRRLLADKTKLVVETSEDDKVKLRNLSVFNQRVLLDKTPAQCIIITHQDLVNYNKLPLYNSATITIGPVHLGPKIVPTLPREQAKQQNSVMCNVSANVFMCINNLLTQLKYNKDDLLTSEDKQIEALCVKENFNDPDPSKQLNYLSTIKKYEMDSLLKCDNNQLRDICIIEKFNGNFVWSHLGAYAICVDQIDTQIPDNLNATPDSINQWMKNGEDIASKKRKLGFSTEVEYTVTSKRHSNPEGGNNSFIAAAEIVTQTFRSRRALFSIFTDVQAMEDSRRCVATREIGTALVDNYLLPNAELPKENQELVADGSLPAAPSSPSLKK